MLNKDKLNKIKGILSAREGTQVPIFKWGGRPFTFTSNGQQITIPLEDLTKTSVDWGTNGGTITYNDQKYEVDANTSRNFSSWHSENIHYKPENQTSSQNEFAQDKMTGYPQAGTITPKLQNPDTQKELKEKNSSIATKELEKTTSEAKSIEGSGTSNKEDVAAEITLPEVVVTNTPTMDAKQEKIEEKQQQQASAETSGVNLSTIGETTSIGSIQGVGILDTIQVPDKKIEYTPPEKKSFKQRIDDWANSPGMKKTAKYSGMAAAGIDMAQELLVDKSQFAEDDPTQGQGRQTYDAVANSLMGFFPIGTIAGGAMKAVGLVNDILGSSSKGFSADQDTLNQVGGSYGGTTYDIQSASNKAGKKYGLFGSGARRKANREIDEAIRKQQIMAGVAKEAADRASSSTILSQANTLSLERQLSGGYDQRYMRAAKEGTKIQYFKDPFKVILSDIKEFQVELSDVPVILKTGGTLLDKLDEKSKIKFSVILSDPNDSEFLKKGGKIRKNEEGEIVPEKCDVCGGDIVVQIHGEPIYLCKECNKFFGVVPFKHKNGGTIKDREIEVIETNTTQKSVIPEGALHKNKHHLDEVGIDDTELTKKGIPVVDNDGDQQAEIELNEIIFTLEVTKELESRYKEFYQEGISEERKNELALEAGKLLWKEIIYNTDDRTGLIDTLKQGGTIGKEPIKKPSFKEWFMSIPQESRASGYDYQRAYNDFDADLLINHAKNPEKYHLPSVSRTPDERGWFPFLKLGRETENPEILGELDWLNSSDPEAVKQRQNYNLVFEQGRYWYAPKKKMKEGGIISQKDIDKMVKQALFNLLK